MNKQLILINKIFNFVSIFKLHLNSVPNTNTLRIIKRLISDMHFNQDFEYKFSAKALQKFAYQLIRTINM
jgi:hypothetical protein